MSESNCSSKPILVEETVGVKYYCTCRQSKNQPYCDGSHRGTNCTPMKVEIEADKTYAYCGCRKSGALPFCDGTHSSL